LEIKNLVEQVHETMCEKGFWDDEHGILNKILKNPEFTDSEYQAVQKAFMSQRLMLTVSELSEALEALRDDDTDNFAEELADTVIRVSDISGGYGWNLDGYVFEKMAKNKRRARKHGRSF